MRMLPEHLTCHAVIRWMERVDGRDLEPRRSELRDNGFKCDDLTLCTWLMVLGDPGFARAIAALDTPALRAAAALRATFWKEGGVHVALRGGKAITVLYGVPKTRRAAAAQRKKLGFQSRRYRRFREAAE